MNRHQDWYVIYVKSQHEKRIDKILMEQHIQTFLPLIETKKQWSDRVKKVTLPLIPSYIFVKVKDLEEFNYVLSINGVFKYVTFGSEYARVRQNEINEIRTFLGIEGLEDIKVSSESMRNGEHRKFKFGPLKGLNCIVVNSKKTRRVIIKIESLSQNITATVTSNYLETYSSICN